MRHADAVEQDQRWTVAHIFIVPAKLVVWAEKAITAIWRFDALFHFLANEKLPKHVYPDLNKIGKLLTVSLVLLD